MPVTDPRLRGSPGAGVRCGVGCQQLHLCRSHLDAETCGLDPLACAALSSSMARASLSSRTTEVRREEACYYEPELNRTYGDLAAHYGVASCLRGRIVHAIRPRRRSGYRSFSGGCWRRCAAPVFSLAELNEAILELVHKLNERPFRKLAAHERSCIRVSIALRCSRCLCSVRVCGVEEGAGESGLSHRVGRSLLQHAYQLVGKEVEGEARKGRWRSSIKASGLPAMCAAVSRMWPAPMRAPSEVSPAISEWTPTRIIAWAGKVGPSRAAGESILTSKPHRRWGIVRRWG